ncbi:MAG: molecular chaperone DnaJ [Clostridia bacterium]|nr:molecular chaperone DnaJ [Clostridia bacterium]
MADKRDYYEVLGIDKGADAETIKKAYRKMAKQYHPDLHPGDADAEAMFKEVNEAYAVLSDDEKKQIYDQYGHEGLDPSSGMGGGGFGGGFGGFDFGDLGDIFGSFFGGGGGGSRRNAPQRGEDLSLRLTLTFEEAAFGCKKEINYSRIEACGECAGSGAAKGTSPETCSRCRGTGSVTVTQRTMFGMMQSQKQCEACRGRGKTVKTPCKNCNGKGYVKLSKRLDVSIPAGIDNGGRICLRGQGNAGANGGSYGDLYIIVAIRPHDIFERENYNIKCEIPVSYSELVLGGEIEVPSLEGMLKYSIPEGTQSGTRFVIRGKGITKVNSREHGDLYFTVILETPKNLSQEAKEALRHFAELCENTNYTKRQRFMDKLANLFKKNK